MKIRKEEKDKWEDIGDYLELKIKGQIYQINQIRNVLRISSDTFITIRPISGKTISIRKFID